MATQPFPTNPELMAITLAYRNAKLIGDDVSPRVPVGSMQFKYYSFPKGQAFTIPDTHVGRKGQPNRVDFSAAETAGSCEDNGLEDGVPQEDILNAPPNYNPLGHATEMLTDLVALDREVRLSDQIFAAANYASGFKVQLAGADQWSDATSDPIGDIGAGLDVPVMRPNVMVIGRLAYSALAKNPKIVEACSTSGADSGIARRKAIAELFELEDILVGEAWLNTAKKGQTATLARVWGKHAALIYRNKLANTQRGLTMFLTAQFGTRLAGNWEDKNVGLRGGQIVRVGESVKEIQMANDLGYFIQDAAA
jgi:hypothetical protein